MEKPLFNCDHCPYFTMKKFNLERHILKYHILDTTVRRERPTFHCDSCDYSTKKRFNLCRHLLKHTVRAPTDVPKREFQCFHCCYITDKKNCLRSHMIRNHLNDRLNQTRITCSVCGLKFIKRSQLREHLVGVHDVAIEEEIRTFTCEKEFLEWKEEIENRECIKYVRNCGVRSYADGIRKQYFNCFRDGFFKPIASRKKALKKQGSNKINSSCPSEMVYTENRDGEVFIYYVSTHYGHKDQKVEVTDSIIDEKTAYEERTIGWTNSIARDKDLLVENPFSEYYIAEEIQSDSDTSLDGFRDESLLINNNLELRYKAEALIDYLSPQYLYSEGTKSTISKILDEVLNLIEAESTTLSNHCVQYEVLSAEAIREKIESLAKSADSEKKKECLSNASPKSTNGGSFHRIHSSKNPGSSIECFHSVK